MKQQLNAAGLALAVLALVLVTWFGLAVFGFGLFVYDDRPADLPKEEAKGEPVAPVPGPPREVPTRLQRIPRTELEQRGQLGDMFGIVGSLLAGLSLVFIVYTVYLQQQQLRQQQREIELQQEDLRNQRLAAEDEKLLMIATSYWEEPAESRRRDAEELLRVIGPALSNRFIVLAEFPLAEAEMVLRTTTLALQRK